MSVQEEGIPKRRSRPEVCCKKVVLRNFAKLTGKHLCQSLFFNKHFLINTFSHTTPLVAASEQSEVHGNCGWNC